MPNCRKRNKNALIRGALIGALLAAPAAHADQLAPGLGGGNQRTRGDAIVRAYHKDAAPLWGFDGRVEFTLASWNGGDRNDALGRRFGRYDLSLAQQHYLNGGTTRPNTGVNFLVLAPGCKY